ncbi:Hypothetical_protein [Hexamita inflata]|uniref:Hypothetical_protein n=1 Tax=Hexamita inflata TaxID=28002 RepID=A0AA86TN06_9EUKA|nr:Hypothetical protein HINF_LOCUS5343 [Hexamita inflata]
MEVQNLFDTVLSHYPDIELYIYKHINQKLSRTVNGRNSEKLAKSNIAHSTVQVQNVPTSCDYLQMSKQFLMNPLIVNQDRYLLTTRDAGSNYFVLQNPYEPGSLFISCVSVPTERALFFFGGSNLAKLRSNTDKIIQELLSRNLFSFELSTSDQQCEPFIHQDMLVYNNQKYLIPPNTHQIAFISLGQDLVRFVAQLAVNLSQHVFCIVSESDLDIPLKRFSALSTKFAFQLFELQNQDLELQFECFDVKQFMLKLSQFNVNIQEIQNSSFLGHQIQIKAEPNLFQINLDINLKNIPIFELQGQMLKDAVYFYETNPPFAVLFDKNSAFQSIFKSQNAIKQFIQQNNTSFVEFKRNAKLATLYNQYQQMNIQNALHIFKNENVNQIQIIRKFKTYNTNSLQLNQFIDLARRVGYNFQEYKEAQTNQAQAQDLIQNALVETLFNEFADKGKINKQDITQISKILEIDDSTNELIGIYEQLDLESFKKFIITTGWNGRTKYK